MKGYSKRMKKDIVYDSVFKPFFNFMYYLLLSPFKVDTDVITGEYILRKNKFQQLACVATHVGTLGISFNLLLHHRSQVLSNASNISRLLESIGYTSSVFAITYFTKKLWWNQGDILAFLKVSRASLVSHKLVYLTSLIAHLLQLVTSYLSNTLQYAAETYVGWILPSNVGTESVTFKIIYYTMFGVYSLGVTLYAMGRLVTMVMAVQLRVMGKEFERFVEKQDTVKRVVEELSCLRNRVELGRKWTNEMVMFYYISILTFLANLPEVVRIYSFEQDSSGQYQTPGVEKWHAVFTCGTLGFFFFIACDMPDRVQSCCQKWIARKRCVSGLSHDDRFLLLALVQDVEGKAVGLSCSFFTLTYSFIGSMLGLVTTYGILVFQMNK